MHALLVGGGRPGLRFTAKGFLARGLSLDLVMASNEEVDRWIQAFVNSGAEFEEVDLGAKAARSIFEFGAGLPARLHASLPACPPTWLAVPLVVILLSRCWR